MFRPPPAECFYCLSVIKPPPKYPHSFKCPHCECYNRYDTNGEILSDEAAMHDPDLNSKSYARRASLRKDRFLPSYGKTVFCHTCQTNQMLLTNLLSNYLPSPEDPDYEKRLEMLPEYQVSVEHRYPPVCSNCLPAVEEEIQNRNHMARTNALGRWLKQSKGKSRQLASTVEDLAKFDRDLKFWKVRGCLWVSALLTSLVVDAAVAIFKYRISPDSIIHTHVLPAIMVSFFPIVCLWNPTDAPMKRAKHQGRDLRLGGGSTYIICQFVIWFLRLSKCIFLFMSSFGPRYDHLHIIAPDLSVRSRLYFSISLMLELFILLLSLSVLRVHSPPAIRLIEPSERSSSAPPLTSVEHRRMTTPRGPPHETDLLASLSLSTKPVIRTTNPVFGQPSLHQSPQTPNNVFDQEDSDAMDWTPTNPSPKKIAFSFSQGNTDNSILKQQQFFPPEEPTGLEPLLARTNLVEESNSLMTRSTSLTQDSSGWIGYYWICTIVMIPALALAVAGYRLWIKNSSMDSLTLVGPMLEEP